MNIETLIQENMWISHFLLILYLFYVIAEIATCVKKKSFEMNEKPLIKQRLFKQAIRLPLVSALYFGFFSWLGHSPQFDSEGFENFIKISKLPIALLSLSLPFVATVASIHRTFQTNKQIEEANKKNLSDSYYSHIKFVTEYFDKLPSKTIHRKAEYQNKGTECKICYPIHLYRHIYSNSNPENGRPEKANIDYVNEINSRWINIIKSMEKFTSPDVNSSTQQQMINEMTNLNIIEKNLLALKKLLCLSPISFNQHAKLLRYEYKLVTNFTSTYEIGTTVSAIFDFTQEVLDIIDDFRSFKENSSPGHIHKLVELISKFDAIIFKPMSIHSDSEEPQLTYFGDKVATD